MHPECRRQCQGDTLENRNVFQKFPEFPLSPERALDKRIVKIPDPLRTLLQFLNQKKRHDTADQHAQHEGKSPDSPGLPPGNAMTPAEMEKRFPFPGTFITHSPHPPPDDLIWS